MLKIVLYYFNKNWQPNVLLSLKGCCVTYILPEKWYCFLMAPFTFSFHMKEVCQVRFFFHFDISRVTSVKELLPIQ